MNLVLQSYEEIGFLRRQHILSQCFLQLKKKKQHFDTFVVFRMLPYWISTWVISNLIIYALWNQVRYGKSCLQDIQFHQLKYILKYSNFEGNIVGYKSNSFSLFSQDREGAIRMSHKVMIDSGSSGCFNLFKSSRISLASVCLRRQSMYNIGKQLLKVCKVFRGGRLRFFQFGNSYGGAQISTSKLVIETAHIKKTIDKW